MKKNLQVAVEAQSLTRDKSGIGSYLGGILSAWKKSGSWPKITLLLQGRKTKIGSSYTLDFPIQKIYLPRKVVAGLRKLGLFPAIDSLVGQNDIYFYPDFVAWKQNSGKSVVMVHDFTYLHYPKTMDQKNKKYLEKNIPKSMMRADHIVVNSEATKKDAIDNYQIPSSKISVVYPGVDHKKYFPKNQTSIDKVVEKYSLAENYILYAGTLEPRKNIVGIIEAYKGLPERLRAKYQLVLAGGQGWNFEPIEQALKESSNLNISTPGYIDEEDLPALYSGAKLFVFPSLFEGFGMPVVEAMACGTAVITSDNSSLPEAAGSAAETVSATDIASLSKKMDGILSFSETRERLEHKGVKQAKKFTWEASATKLKEVFEQVAKAKNE